MTLRVLLAALAAMLAMPTQAQPLPMRAGEYRPAAAVTAKVAPGARMRLDGAVLARRVALARPAAAENRRLVELNGNGAGSAIALPGRPQFVGFGRDVPADARKVDLGALTWTTLADGARTARVEVESPGAASLRVALRLPAMDPGTTLRFAAVGATEAASSVAAAVVARATAQFGEYWSPVIEGERVAVEIEVPSSARLEGTTLEIARVSHLVVGAGASKAEQAKRLQDIGDAGSCNIDVKCVNPQDSVTLNAAAATGELVFTVPSGGTALCSGTLLNDTRSSGTPYLFSANHCFQSAYEASTLEVWWFFQATACGNLTPGNYAIQVGGAALLGRSQDWDWVLMRLNTAPPGGVSFSGWNGATVPQSSPVEIFHHPMGDLMKWSQGTSFPQVPAFFGTAAGGDGTFTRIVWDDGTTEGGSSGGALRTFNASNPASPYLEVRGGLLGGDALCTNPTGSDYFSQFGAMLPLVRQYLTPDDATPDVMLVVEYYHPALDHYFMTASPIEIAILDGGNPPGWQRTGFTFLAYSGPGAGRSPVCRYYQQGNNSHFYSASPQECAQVAAGFPDWIFESPSVFYIGLPNPTTGACAADARPVYRFYHAPVINHRFPAEKTVANALTTTPGWIPEGYGPGPLYTAMCSPLGN